MIYAPGRRAVCKNRGSGSFTSGSSKKTRWRSCVAVMASAGGWVTSGCSAISKRAWRACEIARGLRSGIPTRPRPRSKGAAQPLGPDDPQGGFGKEGTGGTVAGAQHDRPAAAPSRTEYGAAPPAARGTEGGVADPDARAQPGVVDWFQRLVPHPRRPALRSVDNQRRRQPLSAALSGPAPS